MNENEKKEIIDIIDSISYGEITIKKEAKKIVNIKRTESIWPASRKLSEERRG